MKLGMPILYEYDSIKENIDLAKKLGLDFIELNLNFGYCRNEMERYQELEKIIKESNLEYTIHFYDEADFGSYDEVVDAYLKLLEKYLKASEKLNIKLLNIHLNEGPLVTISGNKNYIYEKEYDLYIKRLIYNLKKVKKLTDQYGVNLVLENTKIPNFIEKTYLDLNKEGFSFNYDIGHDYTDSNKLKELIKNNKFDFKEFHLHDATPKKCHLAIGEGEMDLKYYKELAIDAYVVLEVKSSEDLEKSVPIFKKI